MTARPGRPWHEVGTAGAGDEPRLRAELGEAVGRCTP